MPIPTATSPLSLADQHALLHISRSALGLLRPVIGADSCQIIDFAIRYLNPAGQRQFALPEQPAQTLLSLFPAAVARELLACCSQAFHSDSIIQHEITYELEGRSRQLCITAQRHEGLLAVSFENSSPAGPNKLPQALPDSDSHWQAAFTEVENQRRRLHDALMTAPAARAVLTGPEQVYTFVNVRYQQMFGQRELLGKPSRVAVPELTDQPFFEWRDAVYRTGETYQAHELLVRLNLNNDGVLHERYFDLTYQATRNASGVIDGVLVFAYDVTEQALIRQQVQQLNNELEARVAERTQAAQEARTIAEMERSRLASLLMASPTSISILSGPDLVHELVNPMVEQLLPGRALLGKPLLEAVPEMVDTEAYGYLRRAYETGTPYQAPIVQLPLARASDGVLEDHYFNVLYKPRHNEHGHIDGLLVFCSEITEYVQMQRRNEALQAELLSASQQQVQERETLYQVFEQTPASIALLHGPEHRFTYCNQSYQQLGIRPLLGKTMAEILPEDAQGFIPLLDHVYQTGETYFGTEVEYAVEQLDGAPRKICYFNFTYQAYRENQQIIGINIFAYDVTEQVVARQQQQQQQQQLQELFEQAPLSICLFGGPELVYELASQQHRRLFPDRQLLGKPLLEAVPELAGQPVWHTLQQVYQTGETQVDLGVLVPLARTLGAVPEDTYFDYIFQARRDEQGHINGVLVFAFEVTEQVHSRQQMQQLNQRLQASNADLRTTNQQLVRTNTELDNFIYTASHDLRTPIANIEGLLYALRMHLAPAVQQEEVVATMLDMMQADVVRFQTTINQLTDISRLQQAQAAESINLASLIESVRLDLASDLTAANATFVFDVQGCPMVLFSPKNMRSIVYNLLSNAIKYSSPDRKPFIQLRCSCTDAAIVLEVQDNGLGLTQAQQKQLFGMFRRMHDHVAGSGIGLYMVKKIVENAGGTVAVESEKGVGSVFKVSFPR